MESSHKTRKIIGRILLWMMLALLLVAAWTQYTSPIVQLLSEKKNASLRVDVLTYPAMQVEYNPATQKATITVTKQKCKTDSSCLPGGVNAKFFTPVVKEREAFWEQFKYVLANWRYNPLLAAKAAWNYVTAWHDRRTNLSPAEFMLLSMELSQLEAVDFAVKLPPSSKRTRKKTKLADSLAPKTEDRAPLAVQDRPIVVEILNASGKRGLALALTQYLRDKNEKGLLRVDVLQYDNYPTLQEESSIVDYSGRLVQVKQLSQAIGINSEIKSDASASVICDTRIIIGKDFQMPL